MSELLVLWDVDGTLVETAAHGSDAFAEAFERVTGRKPEEVVPMSGRTDLEIALHLLELHAIEGGEERLEAFGEALAGSLAARAQAIRAEGHALPGARLALERLAADPRVVQSLLTGNIRPNALVKLAAFGLDPYVDFDVGAFGSDHRVRGELVALARERASRKHEADFGGRRTVLIGDTPLDVEAARHGGARAVGVASGRHDQQELRRAGADAVLPDLCDERGLMDALRD